MKTCPWRPKIHFKYLSAKHLSFQFYSISVIFFLELEVRQMLCWCLIYINSFVYSMFAFMTKILTNMILTYVLHLLNMFYKGYLDFLQFKRWFINMTISLKIIPVFQKRYDRFTNTDDSQIWRTIYKYDRQFINMTDNL